MGDLLNDALDRCFVQLPHYYSLFPDAVFQETSLDLHDHINPARVTPSTGWRLQPAFDDLLGQAGANQSSAQRQHVGVVMLAAIDGGSLIVAHGCAHARHLVGSHA